MTLRQIIIPIMAIAFAACGRQNQLASAIPALDEPPVYESFEPYFRLGAAINVDQSSGKDSIGAAVAARHFNTIVAENCMKCEKIHPAENEYFWDDADRFVEFGEKNHQYIVGHCLIWHSQLAPWFCVDDKGDLVSADVLRNRMKDHIYTIVGRYKGRVHVWDVVNETVEEDGSYRNSLFYQILGEEYIPLAFQYAHEADPDALLVINDYSMANPKKREKYVSLVNDMKSKGLQVDVIGMQGHLALDDPDFKEFEKSIEAYASTGAELMVTELDMTVLPFPTHGAAVETSIAYSKDLNPFPDGLDEKTDKEWNDRMTEFMKMLIKHSDKISRVNFWGINDKDTWRNDWPVRGRTDYPLMFDREWNIKPFVAASLTPTT